MLETLTILPMAPGTRSRRADVLHRATPVLLPKPKQRQTTLDQHLRSMANRPNSATTRPPPPQAAPPQGLQQSLQQPPQRSPQQSPQQAQSQQRASRQAQHQLQQQEKQQQQQRQLQSQPQQSSHQQQQQLSFALPGQSRSLQNILNHANSMGSMSATRPKRKSAGDADAKPETSSNASGSGSGSSRGSGDSHDNGSSKAIGGPDELDASDSTRNAASRKRPRLAVEIVDYASPRGPSAGVAGVVGAASVTALASEPVSQAVAALSPPKSGAATKTKTNAANTTNTRSLAALPITAASPAPTVPTASRPFSASNTAAPAAAASSASSDSPSTRPLRPAGRVSFKTTSQPATKPPKEKAAGGFKQELKSLQVSSEDAVAVARGSHEGGRSLRSQRGSRFKSELAAYFPEYDEVIGNEPKEEHMLNIDTPIIFVESSAAHPAATALPSSSSFLSTPLAASLRSSNRASPVRVKGYSDKLFYDVFDSHVLDFTFLGNQHKSKGAVDPLPDSYYEVHHKRAERLERSIRNTEKGRAQHEKDQIIRLLDGLQGPDWLRTMGVSGITESKKKTFEPAREHFIRGCRSILEKFRQWSAEEKRRKQEKDRAHAEEVRAREAATAAAAAPAGRGKGKAKTETAVQKAKKRGPGRTTGRRGAKKDVYEADVMAEPNDEDDGVVSDDVDGDEDKAAGEDKDDDDDDDDDDDSQPDSSDFDAVIAQQLREEALARSRLVSKAAASTNKRRKPGRTAKQNDKEAPLPPEDPALPPELQEEKEEVKSFFRKRYQRDAALLRGRRKGRTVMAWGQPVPEVPETEFHLPSDILEDRGSARGAASIRGRRGGARSSARGGVRGGTRSAGRKL